MQQEACTKFCVLRHSETCVTFRLSIHMYPLELGVRGWLWDLCFAKIHGTFKLLEGSLSNTWEIKLLKGVLLGNWSYLNYLLKIEGESVLILSSTLVL